MYTKYSFAFFLLLSTFFAVNAQPTPGVFWHPPKDTEEALKTLHQMKSVGIVAIRTPLIKDTSLFVLADSLKLSFFQELDTQYLPAEKTVNKIDEASRELKTAIRFGKPYRSAKHFGLMRYVNDNNEAARNYIQALMQVARSEGGNQTKAYFTTRLGQASSVSDMVDFVLLDVSHLKSPMEKIAVFRAHHSGRFAVVLGSLVHKNASKGYLNRFSEEAQARNLENQLRELTADATISGIFIKQWQDSTPEHFIPDLDPAESFLETNGLFNIKDQPRLAYEVVKGFFTQTQTTFAISGGTSNLINQFGLPIAFWVFIFLLGIVMLKIPRTADTFALYVVNHDRFREMLKRTNDPLFSLNILLFIVFALSSGAICFLVFKILLNAEGFKFGVLVFSDTVERIFINISNKPAWGFLIGVLLYALITLSKIILFALIGTAFGRSIPLGKVSMLTIWGQLYLPFLAFVGLVISVNVHWLGITDSLLILGIVGGILAFIFLVIAQLDFAALVKLPGWLVLSIAMIFGFGLIFTFYYSEGMQHLPEWGYLYDYLR